jgi:tetratricopeptide (TPR) repeat protein
MTGDYDKAAELFEQSLDLNRRVNDRGMVMAELQNLGLVEIHRGNVDAAERYLAESEKLGSEEDPYSAAMAKLFQAMITFTRGDHDLSRTLLQRAESILKDAKMDASPDDQFEINWLRGKLEESIRD